MGLSVARLIPGLKGVGTMVERYKDFYGCTASIRTKGKGFRLISKTARGRKIRDKVYKTHQGAIRVMNNDSAGTMKRINK